MADLPAFVTGATTVLLLTYAVPYVLFNNMRPVIGMKPWPTRIGSVFKEPEERILYAHFPDLLDEHAWIGEQITQSGCSDVGLRLEYHEFEYLFWWQLGAPRDGITIQYMNPSKATQKYQDPEFTPCALICTVCSGRNEVYGLPLFSDYGHVQYYLDDGPTE